jgi:hypothetical protein
MAQKITSHGRFPPIDQMAESEGWSGALVLAAAGIPEGLTRASPGAVHLA